MGKTSGGAVWLDENKTTPFDFYQYWRNVDDADVLKCIKMLTFIPLEEIKKMESWQGEELNKAKEILAYELTNLVHGKENADKASEAAKALFSGSLNLDNVPTYTMARGDLGINVMDLCVNSGFLPSKSEARRLISQGGLNINGEKVDNIGLSIDESFFNDGYALLKKGKKNFLKVVLD